MIAVARGFVPESACRELADCFERNIGALGVLDSQSVFSYRVLRLRRLALAASNDDPNVRRMRAVRWLATEHLREYFRDPRIYPEETQMVRWSAGDRQPLHVDSERPTTTYAAILYLNDDYVGGETFFEDGFTIRPRTGTLAGFHGASLRHGVRTIMAGRRLTMPIWFTNSSAHEEP